MPFCNESPSFTPPTRRLLAIPFRAATWKDPACCSRRLFSVTSISFFLVDWRRDSDGRRTAALSESSHLLSEASDSSGCWGIDDIDVSFTVKLPLVVTYFRLESWLWNVEAAGIFGCGESEPRRWLLAWFSRVMMSSACCLELQGVLKPSPFLICAFIRRTSLVWSISKTSRCGLLPDSCWFLTKKTLQTLSYLIHSCCWTGWLMRSSRLVTYGIHRLPWWKQSSNQNGFDMWFVRSSFVLTLFIFKAPNYVLARTLTERVV